MKSFAGLVTAFSLLTAAGAHADTVAVTADRMLDVIAGRIVERPQITITDGRITSVAAQGSPVTAGARRVDLPGMTLLPGLIDMHVHLTSDLRIGKMSNGSRPQHPARHPHERPDWDIFPARGKLTVKSAS